MAIVEMVISDLLLKLFVLVLISENYILWPIKIN